MGGSYWQRVSADAVIVIAALFGLLAFAPSWHAYERRRHKTALAVLIASIVFAAVLIDTGLRIGHVYGPHLQQLEQASSH